ncbi:protein Wnt-5a-like isoform X2 [Stylophora pistillata]|uniref:Protein Wnt n=1 Tax=Stylophora pistillata TaxID=50429 RepID=A0A2B4SZJ6_STYPI|nr:protein Wnt-5a-like isoform X2 [Stylophora pistillata]PFX34513.1 Protein Wnt-5a [Stylophora pistillata]
MKLFTLFHVIMLGLSVVPLAESCGSRLTLHTSSFHAKPSQKTTENSIAESDLKIAQLQDDPLLSNITRDGVLRGIKECQKLFENEIWNCPLEMFKMLSFFNNLTYPYATRESAFMYAITAAAITHELTRQCTLGRIPGCGCGTGSGCGENVAFGRKEAMRFFKILRKGSFPLDTLTTVNLHNYYVGAEIVRESSQLRGRCDGPFSFNSDPCLIRTMWRVLAPFEVVSSKLKEKYDMALRVSFINNRLRSLGPAFPIKQSLVYLDDSPRYFVRNDSIGSTGMLGRSCRRDVSDDKYKCELFTAICNSCGLNPITVEHYKRVKCKCKFTWCCRVECETCTEKSYTEIKCSQ